MAKEFDVIDQNGTEILNTDSFCEAVIAAKKNDGTIWRGFTSISFDSVLGLDKLIEASNEELPVDIIRTSKRDYEAVLIRGEFYYSLASGKKVFEVIM